MEDANGRPADREDIPFVSYRSCWMARAVLYLYLFESKTSKLWSGIYKQLNACKQFHKDIRCIPVGQYTSVLCHWI